MNGLIVATQEVTLTLLCTKCGRESVISANLAELYSFTANEFDFNGNNVKRFVCQVSAVTCAAAAAAACRSSVPSCNSCSGAVNPFWYDLWLICQNTELWSPSVPLQGDRCLLLSLALSSVYLLMWKISQREKKTLFCEGTICDLTSDQEPGKADLLLSAKQTNNNKKNKPILGLFFLNVFYNRTFSAVDFWCLFLDPDLLMQLIKYGILLLIQRITLFPIPITCHHTEP